MVSTDPYPWSVPKKGNKCVPDQKPALRPNLQDKEVFSVESLEMCLCLSCVSAVLWGWRPAGNRLSVTYSPL